MNIQIRRFLFLFFLFCVLTGNARPRDLAEALDSLDEALGRRTAVVDARLEGIDSLRYAEFPTERARSVAKARAFRGLSGDSVLRNYVEALNAPAEKGETPSHQLLVIEYARQLSTSGHDDGAMMCLDSLSTAGMSAHEKLCYYEVRSKALLSQYQNSLTPKYKALLKWRARADLDTLLNLVGPYPGGDHLVKAMIYALDGDTVMATGELYEVVNKLPVASPTFAVACGLMADFYSGQPERRPDYLYFLTMASLADALRGNGEAYSLEQLGSEMLIEGDFNRALQYVTVAGEALAGIGINTADSRIKTPMASMLNTMHEQEETRKLIFTGIISLLLVIIIMFVIVLVRVVRRDRKSQHELAQAKAAAEAKDRYITRLFDLCAAYIEAIEDMNRLVSRKIKANQVKDLYEAIESGRIVKTQSERFYETFDQAVWSIYPNFVDDINALLLPDRQIESPEAGRLTPELRIAAFMRLGVTDSARIAKFLGLSLNTVYTYRNRMKNRAIDRENFDAELLKIG